MASLRLFFNESDVSSIVEGTGDGSIITSGVVGGVRATRNNKGEHFSISSLRVVDVLAGNYDQEMLDKVAIATIEDKWEVTNPANRREPGRYTYGNATAMVEYEPSTGKNSGYNRIYVSGTSAEAVCDLYEAIRVGNGKTFMTFSYDQPEGSPSYKELERQLMETIAALNDTKEHNKTLIGLNENAQADKANLTLEYIAANDFIDALLKLIRKHFWARRAFKKAGLQKAYEGKLAEIRRNF